MLLYFGSWSSLVLFPVRDVDHMIVSNFSVLHLDDNNSYRNDEHEYSAQPRHQYNVTRVLKKGDVQI